MEMLCLLLQQGREVADSVAESHGSRSRSDQRSQGKGMT